MKYRRPAPTGDVNRVAGTTEAGRRSDIDFAPAMLGFFKNRGEAGRPRLAANTFTAKFSLA